MSRYTIEKGYKRDRRWPYFMFPLALLLFAGYLYTSFIPKSRPGAPVVAARVTPVVEAASKPKLEITKPLSWPSYGQAAYGVVGDGTLTQSNENAEPVPIASLAKVITALVILDKKPLSAQEQGPVITLTDGDVALYHEYVSKDGTVVPVRAGMQISQYQALQAMLLPSANNIADTLAIWAFGSVEGYSEYANNMLKNQGLTKTTVAGASGYSPFTKSTADEMVKIGIMYLENPVLKEIATQTEADIPYAGRIQSYHAAINDGQTMGIKVGYTESAGSTFLAADIRGSSKDEISVAAVLGATGRSKLLQDVKNILKSGNQEHDLLMQKP